MFKTNSNYFDLLMIEDDYGDIELTKEALEFSKARINLHIAMNAKEAFLFLYKNNPLKEMPKPDIILLDLNLPGDNGFSILKKIKHDNYLKIIPVLIFTTSQARDDIVKSYSLGANSFITKPSDIDDYINILKTIDTFWFSTSKLPPKESFYA